MDARVSGWRKQLFEATSNSDWDRAVEIADTALELTPEFDSSGVRAALVRCHLARQDLRQIDEQLRIAVAQYPENWEVRLLAAEREMSRGDVSAALSHWQALAEMPAESAPKQRRMEAFPLEGATFDWHESAWLEALEAWDLSWKELATKPRSRLYYCLIQTFVNMGEPFLADQTALRALKSYPKDAVLSAHAVEAIVRGAPGIGVKRAVERILKSNTNRYAEKAAEELAESASILDDVAAMGPTMRDELRILTIYRGTGAFGAVRSANFWDEARIHAEALRLAKRDSWPEQTAEVDIVSERAWTFAREFAEPRAELVGVETDDLARAVFHFFKQELTQKIPVERIAQEIRTEFGDEPVFLDLGTIKIPYMASYPGARMQTIYLYDALRRLECNVSLVRFPRKLAAVSNAEKPRLTAMPKLSFTPAPAQLQPPVRILESRDTSPASLLVPSGIRSVKRVLDRLGDAVVTNSGSAVKGYAYDQSIVQDWDYSVHASMHHGMADLLPSFEFTTTASIAWRRNAGRVTSSPLAPSNAEPVVGFVSQGIIDTSDWYQWLERAIIPYLKALSDRAGAELRERAIMDVHVGDYLYAEPALVAAQAKKRGARVHIWPHSTNPVHVGFHAPRSVDTIHAVTRSGTTIWRDAFPDTKVSLDANLMNLGQEEKVSFVPGEPLSVIVIGGRPVMRNLPILDIGAHEELYRKFFAGLQGLADEGLLNVYFKPRGKTGEHERWLEHLVGQSASWRRVREHPMRITLPNPIYVSLSVGSSALLEGAARGIPGLIVKEGYARNYLATEADIFPQRSSDETISLIEEMLRQNSWEAVREDQTVLFRRELREAVSEMS